MIMLNHLLDKIKLNEGLIYSASSNKTADMIKMWSDANSKFSVRFNSQKIILNFQQNLTLTELNNLLRLINALGWYVSGYISGSSFSWKKFNVSDFIENEIDQIMISFQLEAKYDLEVDASEIDVLYHISPSKYQEKISKIGLVPKSMEKILSHPERIYLVDEEESVNILLPQFKKINPDNEYWTVFEIDFKSLKRDNPAFRLFSDPNFIRGIYTLENIPPKYLKIKYDITID